MDRLHQSFPRFQPPADLTGSPGTAEDKVGTVLEQGLEGALILGVGCGWNRGDALPLLRALFRANGEREIPVDGRFWLAV